VTDNHLITFLVFIVVVILIGLGIIVFYGNQEISDERYVEIK